MFHLMSCDGYDYDEPVRKILEKFRMPSSCKMVQMGKVSKSRKPTTLIVYDLPADDREGRLKMVRLVDWVRNEYLLKRRSVIVVYTNKRASCVFDYLLDEGKLKLYPPDGWMQYLSRLQFYNGGSRGFPCSAGNLRAVLERAASLTGLI